jgi:hypothetical protein
VLESLLGSVTREKVLLFLYARDEGYAREIASYYGTNLDPVQKQLETLEQGGILFSRTAGRTRLYAYNPRYPFQKELFALLGKALTFYSDDEKSRLILIRRRPRRKGKPL